ncbi:protein phosphatase 2C 32-like [Zingiber officinale]|uniref:PPM-type phosphatase domain-containing protein n=1 Tax=Zingiber officinale TaxID=94328 RepID=A0A8J5LJ00_ZINOF|nr:protein phosphatase 2C 32-like [Zingiber officinale]KAG6521746.1 hypothetical protein ZIOFF_018872 [Zingiber officinale]
MGNGTSRAVGCFVPSGVAKDGVDLDLLEPLDEGLGHSFCYVRPVIVDSPAITPSNSDRYTVVSNTLDSDTRSASFRQEIAEESQRASKNSSETTFRTISGASVSANTSTARTGNPNVLISNDTQEPAASFESTASFASVPLQPLPRGSGPLNAFMSGPLGRGFASGPLERGASLMSGPLDKGFFMSGPLDSADTSSFSAPLGHGRGKTRFGQLVRSMSRPMTSVLSKTFTRRQRGSGWIHRFLLHPMSHLVWHSKDTKPQSDPSRNCLEAGTSELEYCSSRNLQWAHGKAGEDRVHVVLSEEQGWLFVGIYDGFSGPDAPDFLMNNLYKAVDKELEGLLWYYEDKSGHIISSSDLSENDASKISSGVVKQESLSSDLQQGELWNSRSVNLSFGNQCEEGVALDPSHEENFRLESSMGDNLVKGSSMGGPTSEGEVEDNKLWCEIPRDCNSYRDDGNLDAGGHADVSHKKTSCISEIKSESRCRKNKRLYELLQMELLEDHGKDSYLSSGNPTARSDSWDLQLSAPGDLGISSREISSPVQPVLHSSSTKRESLRLGEELVGIQESNAVVRSSSKESKQKYVVSFSTVGQKQMMRASLFGTRLRKMYRKHKFSHRKLFSWSYYGSRNPSNIDDRVDNSSVIIRRCKSGPVDHDAVLKAMTRALEATEEAFVDMVEKALDRNPELALMGSCVLVMLMKDQDVYVINLGDSRVILAQDRLNDVYDAQTVTIEDARHQNSMRDSLVHMELDRISEESPMHNPKAQLCNNNKTRELSLCSLKMRAVQLSSDHSTSIEEEVLRIKAEHHDDAQAVFNDRVKGQLKVTRAFGAEFLKKPKLNQALLEMFRVDYIGDLPYISCSPSVLHHHLCSSDRFLVLSSDGLYQYFSNEEVVSHITWFMENAPDGDPAQYLIAELLIRAAKKNGMDFHELLDIPQGDRRKYHDDVSVMVVSLEGRIWRSSS